MAKILYISIKVLATLIYPFVFVIFMGISIASNAGNRCFMDETRQDVRNLLRAFKDMWS